MGVHYLTFAGQRTWALMEMNVQCTVQHLVMEMKCLAMEEKIGMAVYNLISVHLPKVK